MASSPLKTYFAAPSELFRAELLKAYAKPLCRTEVACAADCGICLEFLDISSTPRVAPSKHALKDDSPVALRACNHAFHWKCALKWTNYNTKCPLCRSAMCLIPPSAVKFALPISDDGELVMSNQAMARWWNDAVKDNDEQMIAYLREARSWIDEGVVSIKAAVKEINDLFRKGDEQAVKRVAQGT